MRVRLVGLALLTAVVGACAAPRGSAAQESGSAPATTVPTRTAAAQESQARFPPPGIVAVDRRRPAPRCG